ncbi:MAG: hypothetical protein H0X31_01050 [Nostocaceae cyanobacterium]|nr:hypothetical protein [Nostocaceae cyanobacterium]
MLNNLDTIDWNKLGAGQVPQLIRTVYESDAKEERYSRVFEELQELLYPQGIADHWDWGGPRRMMQNDLPQQVTSFLVEILGETKSLDKMRDIVSLLGDLCKYEYYHEWLGSEGQAEYIEWSRRLRDKVRLGLPLYQQYLTSDDEYLKGRVRELVKWMEYK